MNLGTLRLAVTMTSALVLADVASASTPQAMQAGEWARTTKFDVTSPLAAKLLPKSFQSTVCISPDVAKRGPIAIALVEDGPDCQLTSSNIGAHRFSATRTCRGERGAATVYQLTGHFTADMIDFDSRAHTARGTPAGAHSEARRTGPCRANTPLPGQ